MSWGQSEFAGETAYDSVANQPRVTFLACAGDLGVAEYPAYSPNVVAVGGTSLNVDTSGDYLGESYWDNGYGEGGYGTSTFESQPSYQNGKVDGISATNRTAPDVSMNAGTLMDFIDSLDGDNSTLESYGAWGTSLATPMFAGLIALADQGRGSGNSLDSNQTLSALYNLSSSDFHEVTQSNGTTTAGYQAETGLGTPVANLLVPALVGGEQLASNPGGGIVLGSGATLTDSTTLSGADNPTGTITFTLYAPNGTTVVDTEFDTVNGNGTYNTPNGFVPAAAGTYQWVVSYSGDSNNNPVSDPEGSGPELVSPVTPTLTTTTGSTVFLGSGNKLTDSATLMEGDNATGTITFTLYAPNGTTVVDTETDTVAGNGTYYTTGYVPTAQGVYEWVVSYSGDSNNAPVSSPEGNEPESVILNSPTLTTTPGGSVVLGGSGTLTDSATLTQGDNPTGTIIFTLFAPGGTTVVDTQTVTVNGNGTYSTPTGYVPTTAGTYQWTVNYSGDSNNNPAGAASLSTLTSFQGSDGETPDAGVILDSTGDLYGTTAGPNDGTIFELPQGGNVPNVLANFNGTDGNDPLDSLIMDGAGNLYGTTDQGGTSGDGTIFELAKGSNTPTILASFSGSNGSFPIGGLVMDSSGNLYGTTWAGGVGAGTIFELAKGSSTIITLASFNGNTEGSGPFAGLIIDSAGNLYGTAPLAGASNDGTIFELAKGSSTITALASFNGTDGMYPYAGLIMDSSGNLYGTAIEGGTDNAGTIFELPKGSGTITTLASFNGNDGLYPYGGLFMDGAGNLYGTTSRGGLIGDSSGDGVVYELTKGANTITDLVNFDGANGFNPYLQTMVMDGAGNLYGTTQQGVSTEAGTYGTVFELVSREPETVAPPPATPTLTTTAGGIVVLGSGTSLTDSATLAGGNNPTGTITFTLTGPNGTVVDTETDAVDGNGTYTTPNGFLPAAAGVYQWGVTYSGDSANNPVVTPNLSTLATFNGGNGAQPADGALFRDANGNLYGATRQGGSSSDGTIFELPNGSSTVTTLASFNGTNGANPASGLIMDSAGNLYGTTQAGGADSDGTVFELPNGSSTIITLASFNGTNGASPANGLIMDSVGNLYGTAQAGGAGSDGTVFELAKGSSTITVLASFSGSNGSDPFAGLIMDSAGNLYGTTTAGGAFGGARGDGTIFELVKGSGTITSLASFNGSNGAEPEGVLVMDTNGNLYGTTHSGGSSSYGVVFELPNGSSTITTLANFNDTNGEFPGAGLTMDSAGNLYGTAQQGGAFGDGTVFELLQGSGTISVLASFQGSNGQSPRDLIIDSAGNLYGETGGGGASGDGTLFELSPPSSKL